MERIPADRSYAVRDNDGRQGGAMTERMVPDFGDADRDGDRCQGRASVERIGSDGGDAGRDGDGCQGGTIPECRIADGVTTLPSMVPGIMMTVPEPV